MRSNKRATICFLFIPSLIVVGLYLQVGFHDYLSYDDPGYTYENMDVMQGVSLDGIRWAFEDSHFANYHPITWISHMVDFSVFGDAPGLFALENAWIHALNALLLTLLLSRLFRSRGYGLLGGIIFAAHPVLIESVAWISQRKTLLATFWILSSLLFYVRWREVRASETRDSGVGWYVASAFCFYISLFCKSMFVTLPVLLLLLELMFTRNGEKLLGNISGVWIRREGLPLAVRLCPFIAGSLAFSVLAIWSQTKGGAVSEVGDYMFSERLRNMLVGYSSYLMKFFYPTHLSIFYPFDSGIGIGEIFLRGSVLMVISTLLYRFRKVLGLLPLLGWLFFLVSLLPVIGLVQIGAQSYADRYMYGPIIGLIMLIVSTVHHFVDSVEARMRTILVSGMLIWVLFLGIVGFFQIGNWKNDFTIARSILAFDSVNPIAADLMASSLIKYGHYEEAIEIVQQQIAIYPLNYTNYGKLALCLFLTDRREEALAYQQKFIEMNPRKGAGVVNMVKFLYSMGKRQQVLDLIGEIDDGDYELHQSEVKILEDVKSEIEMLKMNGDIEQVPSSPERN